MDNEIILKVGKGYKVTVDRDKFNKTMEELEMEKEGGDINRLSEETKKQTFKQRILDDDDDRMGYGQYLDVLKDEKTISNEEYIATKEKRERRHKEVGG